MSRTWELAQGRWPQILAALGVPTKVLDGRHHPCPLPGCGGKDRFRFDDANKKGDYICSQCGAGQGFTFLKKLHGWNFRQAAYEIDKVIDNLPRMKLVVARARMSREDVAKLWKEAKAITPGDAVGVYLSGRGIRLPKWPYALRYVARMWHAPSRKYQPCMLALYRSADGKTGTIHRTYLGEVEPRRMFVPFGVPKGGAIMLFDGDHAMGVAEGIETALSAAIIFKMPVWACANEGMLRAWQPPKYCKRVTIFGDNDSSFVGQAAAYHLAWRLGRDKYHVTVEIPHTPDWDWNDVLRDQNNDFAHSDLSQLRMLTGNKPTS